MIYHESVLLNESVEALNIVPDGKYIDGTFGLGGHSKLILSKLNKCGRLIAMDRDCLSVRIGKLLAQQDKRFIILHAPFSKMFTYLQNMNLVGLINGVLLDLGICAFQLFDSNRGFSFIKDGFLDMRMDVSMGRPASEWLNIASMKNIDWVLRTFGEEKFSKKIAKSIVLKRKINPILRSSQLSKIVSDVIPNHNKYYRKKHPATRSFLAIRMYINEELKEITQILQKITELLSPKGRLVVISFNSLEDRLVKHFIYQNSRMQTALPKLPLTEAQRLKLYSNTCLMRNIGKLTPTVKEIRQNIRARSAIMRCAEKLSIYV